MEGLAYILLLALGNRREAGASGGCPVETLDPSRRQPNPSAPSLPGFGKAGNHKSQPPNACAALAPYRSAARPGSKLIRNFVRVPSRTFLY